ncbi:MAG: DUF192 domain-containing protein [Phycisphaerales bacterium]|nr:DUF192 domain-containing protein [Phycisphaerales bacterium]MCI0630172.1 DUF192 domain-containing protein [Phycisphaerales bacterium]MCI0674887.1 DUF192 domain-containing protein [Phycisphaerales bacterium]
MACAIEVKLAGSAVIALALAFWLIGCGGGGANQKTETVVINGETFDLELAIDESARTTGLKHRTSIPEHGGMLFVFPDSKLDVQSFWMHECLVNIDIIYLDPRGSVTATHRMKAQPPKGPEESEADYQQRHRQSDYSSVYPAQFAIELKAGWLDQLDLHVDDRIELDLPRLKRLAR